MNGKKHNENGKKGVITNRKRIRKRERERKEGERYRLERFGKKGRGNLGACRLEIKTGEERRERKNN